MDTLNSEFDNKGSDFSSLSTFKNKDTELGALASQAVQSLGIDRLDQLVKTYKRFNEPVYVVDEQGVEKRDNNFKLKRLLKEIPDYMENARHVGLTEDQSHELIIHLLKSSPYKFSDQGTSILLMGRAFEVVGQKNELLNNDDFKGLKSLVGDSAKYGVENNAMYAFYLTQKIGLTTKQSIHMISKLIDADGSVSGYSFGPFCDALKTLNISEVDSELVIKVFDELGGKRPWFNMAKYKAFEDIITFGCPTNLTTPQEVMETILRQVEAGDSIEEALTRILRVDRKLISTEDKFEIVNPQEDIQRYFINKPGNLEIAALPYQTHKPFKEGVRDLEKIAIASFGRWEDVGEGFWVYDQESETWYSLGGQTELMAEAVRHNMNSYDISQLSDSPTMFHCHPEEFEVMISPPRDNNFFPDQFRDQVTKFLSATPSRADYIVVADFMEQAKRGINPRSYIVSSLGITEFIYPNNVDQIKQMSVQSRDIRNQALLDFDWERLLDGYNDALTVTTELIDLLNQKLPDGFSMKFYSKGSNIEE